MPIDLRSDTVTRPTAAMRQAIATADVGDDERDGDPTMRRLEERVATLLGKDGALFFPSGCMGNQAAIWTHVTPGTEILLDADAHVIHWEVAGAAALSGVQIRPVQPTGAVMSADDLSAAIRPRSRYSPAPSLVCVENTHNSAGGKVTSAADLIAIRRVAQAHGLPVHMDGARLWNASIASGTPLAQLAAAADTVMVAFSKGLGAPVGAMVAGPAALMERLWMARKLFGGALRQSGILAAAALHALDHHMDRLAEDHANAARLAAALDGVAGTRVAAPDTNIVMVDVAPGTDVDRVLAAAEAQGVLGSAWSRTRIRLVTHLDVSRQDCERAADVFAAALRAGGNG
jgi:threonine aldolase